LRVVVAQRSGQPRVTVADVEDLGSFHVECNGLSASEVRAALADVGAGSVPEGEGEHAWISVAFLERHRPDGAPDWPDDFAKMCTYAASKGWVSPSGNELRGHLVDVVE
jgi:hypothetical protein